MVRPWAPYIVIAALVGATAAVATIVLIEPGGPDTAGESTEAVMERQPDLEPWPVRSTAEIKADRHASRAPPPPVASASMFLDTARQFMIASVVAPAAPPARPTTAILDDQQIFSSMNRLKINAFQE